MRPIPKQYISKDDYPKNYLMLDEEEATEVQLRAVEKQYDRWVDDLLDRILDLEEQLAARDRGVE